jgi:hypothetical protein
MPQSISQDTKTNPITPALTAASAGFNAPTPSNSSGHFGNAAVEDRMTVYKAARAVHRSPAFVKSFIDAGLLRASRKGGPVKRPWLAVNLSELLAVIDRETLYVPPAMIGRRAPRPRVNKLELHPLAAAI